MANRDLYLEEEYEKADKEYQELSNKLNQKLIELNELNNQVIYLQNVVKDKYNRLEFLQIRINNQ
jgi:predicted  nucleic acid-binding Zn-ribbon protein